MMTPEELRAAVAADPLLRLNLRKKFIRSKIRLEHSLAADVAVKIQLERMQELGTAGVEPQLTSSAFDEVFG